MSPKTKRNLQLRSVLLTLLTGVALFGLVVPNGRADEMDKKTILAFSNRVQFPGITLDRGTYVVKRVDYNVGKMPDVLQISNKEETQVYGLVKAIPVERFKPAERITVTFYETKGLTPPAVRAVWYPGEKIGEQFLYPKGGAVLMALAGEKVTRESNPPAAEPAPPAPLTTEPEASAAPSELVPEQATEPENTEIAQATTPAPTAPPEPTTPQETTQKELPKTSSNLPLLASLGGLALAAGTGLKRLAKQSN